MTIQPFSFNGADVRTLVKDGQPWFIAADVCRVLQIANTSDALNALDADEQAGIAITDTSSNGTTQRRDVLAVNEPGLYSLVLRSRKPEAKAFKRWITHEVLPAIRKTGSYSMVTKIPTLEETLETALRLVRENKALEARCAELQPKAEFADALACSKGAVGFDIACKTVGLPFGRNTLIKHLIEDGYLYRKGRSIVPMQRYIESGDFEMTAGLHERSAGPEAHYITRVTPKGLDLVRRLYLPSTALSK